MEDARGQIAARNARDGSRFRAFAVATAMVLVGVMSGGAATPAFSTVASQVARALAARIPRALAGAAWRTFVRVVDGESFREAVWGEGGQLLVSFMRPERGLATSVLAGVSRAGLSDQQSSAVTAAIARLASTESLTAPTMGHDGVEHAALFAPHRQLDVAAELLRRGRVRLDTSDQALLAQQPGLVRAARDALAAQPNNALLADPGYRARVQTLATQHGL